MYPQNPTTAQLRRAVQELSDTRGRAESADGLVQAETGRSGELFSLSVDPRVYRGEDAEELAEEILSTVTAAQEDFDRLAFRVVRTVFPGVPEDSADPAFALVLAALDRLTGDAHRT